MRHRTTIGRIRRRVLAGLVFVLLGVGVPAVVSREARAQVPVTDPHFELELPPGCVVFRCSPNVVYSPEYVAGGYRVEVQWDVQGDARQTFAADAVFSCGDSTPGGPASQPCVLRGPPYTTPGHHRVGVRVTGPDGIPALDVRLLYVAEAKRPRGRQHRDGGLCPRYRPGVHCGPGNNRRTPGGGGKVSHEGWPAVSGIFWVVEDNRGHANGAGSPLNDELLGGHGSDHLRGGAGKDILWGDYHPTANNARQHDTLSGGPGADFIYTSHGTNIVSGGAGRDRIYAHWGHGVIDCGPGNDWVGINHYPVRYTLRHCEHRVQW
jgi:hypothetical protein